MVILVFGGVNNQISSHLCFTAYCEVYDVAIIGTTLPETNIAPETRPLEKEIPIGDHHF